MQKSKVKQEKNKTPVIKKGDEMFILRKGKPICWGKVK